MTGVFCYNQQTMKVFRRTLFFILLVTAFSLAGLLVWWELILPMQLTPLFQFFFFLLGFFTFALLIWHLLRIHVKKPNAKRVFITFGLAGLSIHLLCAALFKNTLIWIPGVFAYEAWICRVFGLIAVSLNFLGIHSALSGPRVKHIQISIPPRHAKLHGFKIAQISDLHIGPLIRRNYVSRVVSKTQALKANIIVLTGDIGDSDPHFFGSDASPLEKLQAPEGIFYVTGNHEYYWGAEEWIRLFKNLGLRALINEGVQVAGQKIWLGGIADPDSGYFVPEHHPNAMKALTNEKSQEAYKILLAHQPKSCFDAEKAGFDLMLCGHTHGGQFFPFNLIVKLVNPYSRGLNQHGAMKVYVNQGAGFWGPALRLGVKSEIALIELVAN